MTDPRTLRYDVVVPTVGRPSLRVVLEGLAEGDGPLPERVILVDDRPDPDGPLVEGPLPPALEPLVTVVRSGGRGPAAARNVGWRAGVAPWVAFLDDDVSPPPGWRAALALDLSLVGDDVAASQGRITVPLPVDRAPTDWERNVAGLETAQWATADMAYRRRVLDEVGGFDERFPRAYREDADLGLRVTDAGHRILRGHRRMVHPVRPADAGVSVRMQAGNADDPFMRALHGRDWRARAGVPGGRRPWHLATVTAAIAAAVAAATGRHRTAALSAAAWVGLTADFAFRRIAPGPRTRDEIVRMTWTSAVVPFAATAHWLRGVLTLPVRLSTPGPLEAAVPSSGARPPDAAAARERDDGRPAAVLFDRDGTLVHDVPYNGDPAAVRPVDGARELLDRIRDRGIPVGLVSNQSGVARGYITRAQVDAVNARVEELLGPFATVQVCLHGPDDGCRCRKPGPGMVEQAAAELGVDASRCVLIGDIGSDVAAAEAAGARGILVPTDVTRIEEIDAATEVADDLAGAVALALGESAAAAVGASARGAA